MIKRQEERKKIKLKRFQGSSGGERDEGLGEFRQTGQEAFKRSHSSIQSAWKQCWQAGMVLRVSLGLYSDKHIGQMLSSGLGNLRLSPKIVLG